MFKQLTLCTALLASSCLNCADAHGFITNPMPEFNDQMKSNYVATLTSPWPGKFDDSPERNVAAFTAAFKTSSYKTLRDFIETQGPACGNTNPNASPRDIPADSKITFQNGASGEGFVPSHTGPCEIWLDNKLVFHDEDCAGHFKEKPAAHLPVDFSSCQGNCLLRFYWLALHEPQWQVYKNCIPLKGKGQKDSNQGNSDKNGQGNPTPSPTNNGQSTNSNQGNMDEYNKGQGTTVSEYGNTPAPTQQNNNNNYSQGSMGNTGQGNTNNQGNEYGATNKGYVQVKGYSTSQNYNNPGTSTTQNGKNNNGQGDNTTGQDKTIDNDNYTMNDEYPSTAQSYTPTTYPNQSNMNNNQNTATPKPCNNKYLRRRV